jgi:iron complex outermembrane receptor protein
MFSHVVQDNDAPGQILFQAPVPASNAFNPFGQTVLVTYKFNDPALDGNSNLTTNFLRGTVGARGQLGGAWNWELTAWESQDRSSIINIADIENVSNVNAALASGNPATALNLFTSGPARSEQILNSLYSDAPYYFTAKTLAADFFVRGPLAYLPAGPINVVVGGEFDHDQLLEDTTSFFGSSVDASRHEYSFFGEARAPLLGGGDSAKSADILALTGAVRWDHYSDFGSHTTPQIAAEWRPIETLVFRGGYAKAFAAPSLFALYSPQVLESQVALADPRNGNATVIVPVTVGGNPQLQPQTGQSRFVGFAWSPKAIGEPTTSVTFWTIDQASRVTSPDPQVIVDNENLFPGRVVRGPTGAIESVDATSINFGALHVKGVDFGFGYKYQTPYGLFTPSLNATDTVTYLAAVTPNAPETSRLSMANTDAFAPRWKGTVGLEWRRDPVSINVDGRYVGRYQDYAPLANGQINYLGNFWLTDLNVRYKLVPAERRPGLESATVAVGAVNLFNSLPKFSDYGNSLRGYDPAEYDIRGRYIYLNLEVTF